MGFGSIMLMNLMASRLYRKTKLTRYDGVGVSVQLSRRPPLRQKTLLQRGGSGSEVLEVFDGAYGLMPASGPERSAEKSCSLALSPAPASQSNV